MKINHPIVNSYFVKKLPNGVYMLTFSCNVRNPYYHRYSKTEYLFMPLYESVVKDEYTIKIEEFLPDINGLYLIGDSCEKDEVNFFFIPFHKEWLSKINKEYGEITFIID